MEKQSIANALQIYCDRVGSKNRAANTLKGVSSATISQITTGKWDLISDEMWRNVATQIGLTSDTWEIVPTRTFQLMTEILRSAQETSCVFAVTGPAGSGKTVAIRQYAKENRQVYVLSCNEFWNRKVFLQELLTAMGRDWSGLTVPEMMQDVVRTLKTSTAPLIVMDEADKLSDQVLYFFITLYNSLEDHCGIVLCATAYLKKRIDRGIRLGKKGYAEIYSRMGRSIVPLSTVTSTDVMSICAANGIIEKASIKEVVEDAEGDLRRVKRKIQALKIAA